MAMWKATYRRPNCLPTCVYYNAADARSMTKAAQKKAVNNAVKRALSVLEKKGVTDARIVQVNCVG